ncbi:hypothetical protein ATANTOWER_010366, partial [Ataeniobius toweri]|nr:hypothetical protein [Ataeniobius toweri]
RVAEIVEDEDLSNTEDPVQSTQQKHAEKSEQHNNNQHQQEPSRKQVKASEQKQESAAQILEAELKPMCSKSGSSHSEGKIRKEQESLQDASSVQSGQNQQVTV